MLANIARTSISTKLSPDLTNLLVDIVVESILIIKKEE
jgi:T-complex protein 1 subunit zeta